VAAGLGGGSSDAGAVLRALGALWGATADLAGVGATIGSDVPFFATGGAAALVTGRGERVAALPPSDLWIALVTLPARSATAQVYSALGPDARGDGRASATLADLFRKGAATGSAVRALLHNDLATAAEKTCPAIGDARSAASAAGIDLMLSGSGPSLYALADDRAHAIRLARALRRAGLRARPRSLCVEADVLRM
jgi:4-diphosphocytidyl-2-C-methyl-D-erythritol kinase